MHTVYFLGVCKFWIVILLPQQNDFRNLQRPFLGKFLTILENSQETFFVESLFVQVRNSGL